MKTLIRLTGVVCMAAMLYGCVPFKEVGTFTASSQKSFQSMQLPYGPYQFCKDSCYINNTHIIEIADLDCNCRPDSLADTVLQNEFSILGAYYAALTKLSGVSLIDFGPLAKSVKQGTYGKITVSSEEATTFTNLSGAITSLVTLEYKSKKLKEFISDNDATVLQAIDKLDIQLMRLDRRIIDMARTYKITIRNYLNNASPADKLLLANIYRQKTDQLELAESNLAQLRKTLQKISEGEVLLKKNVDNLKSAGFKQSILGIAGDIIYLNSKSN